ncbi:MAG: M1 family peptidase, partial [Gemmatimonadales bacterium]
WFWTNWFFGNAYIDLGVKGVAKARGGYAVTVDNIGGMDAPFDLVVTLANGSTQRLHQTAAVWSRNGRRTVVPVRASQPVQAVTIDGGIWVDADTTNNSWKR